MFGEIADIDIINTVERKLAVKSVMNLFLTLACSIFIAEPLVVLYTDSLSTFSLLTRMSINATLLVMLLFPMLYMAIFRPLSNSVGSLLQAKRILQNREARYRALISTAHDAIITADSSGFIVDWNQGAESIFGYARHEIIGQSLMLLMPHRYHDAHLMALNRLASGGKPQIIGKTVEVEGVHKDGKEFPLELSLAKWSDGDNWFVTGIIRNIVERKRIDIDLRMAAAAFESLDAKTITDTNQIILMVNKAFTRITGYSSGDVVGKTLAQLGSGRHDAEFYQGMQQSLSKNGKWQGKVWSRHKNGDICPEWLNITAVMNDEGAVTHYLSTFTDIAARKSLEEETPYWDAFP